MNYIDITTDHLSVEDVSKKITSPECGALSVFVGMTRNHCDGKKVLRLEYEAYEKMAKKEIEKICSDIRERWNVVNIAVCHRLGIVELSEASVIIAVTSEHRQDSLKATEFAINKLKATVPIWKKEIYAENKPQWKENIECAWHSVK